MAYRAEIEIGVKGAQQLEAFKKQLDALGKLVDQTNKREIFGTKQVTSVNEYNSALRKATETLNNARLQLDNTGKATKTYEKAIKAYVTALGNANQRQEIQNKLIQDEIKLREEAARAARRKEAGIQGGTQYSGPIGPGPASPIDVNRLLKAKKEQLEYERALFNLAKKTAEPLNRQLQLQEGLIKGAREALELAQQAKRIQGPALPPGFNFEKGAAVAASKQVEAMVHKSAEASKRAVQQVNQITLDLDRKEHKAKIDQILKEFEIEERLQKSLFDKAIALDKKEGAAFDKKLAGRISATETSQKRRKDALNSAIIGGAFPLLFGQGIGAAVGGGIGGFAGGLQGGQAGFALSLAGTTIGSLVDTLVEKTKELGEAFTDIGSTVDGLTSIGYKFDDQTKTRIEQLVAEGRNLEALNLIMKETGITPEQVESFMDLNDAFEDVRDEGAKLITVLASELAPTIENVVKFIRDRLKELRGEPAQKELARTDPKKFQELMGQAREQAYTRGGNNPFERFIGSIFFGGAMKQDYDRILTELSEKALKTTAPSKPKPAVEDLAARMSNTQFAENQAKNAELELKFQREVVQYRSQSVQLLDRELALLKMTSEEDRYKKATLEAQLNVDKQRLELKKALEATARAGTDAGARISATKDVFAAQDALKRAEAEAAVAREAERVYNIYTKQADALNQVALAGKMRLAQDTAALEGQQKIDQAYYQAALALNNVELQRARQAGDVQKIRRLEIAQANIIYNQTIAAIRAEVERVKLKQRQVALATKESEVALYRAAAEGRLTDAHRESYKLQLQALAIANYNVEVQAKVANYQTQTAKATNEAAVAAANFAASQQQAAAAAQSTAAATQRTTAATKDSFQLSPERPGTWTRGSVALSAVGGTSNLAVNQYARQFLEGTDMSKDAYSAARERQDLALRRLARKQSYERYKQEAAELASIGIFAPSNPYSDYRSITAYAPGRGSYSFGGLSSRFAEGGYVTSPTKALVGERGENEYVIPESKMQSSMARYARGARGEAVVEGNGSDNGMGRRTARGTTTVNVSTGPVVRMGNKDYVTVADLNNAVGSVVATLSRDTSDKYGTNPRIS